LGVSAGEMRVTHAVTADAALAAAAGWYWQPDSEPMLSSRGVGGQSRRLTPDQAASLRQPTSNFRPNADVAAPVVLTFLLLAASNPKRLRAGELEH
jgi:hypothetical protein